jgi:glutamine synthetase
VHKELKENQSFDTYLRLMKNADYVLLHFTDMLGYLKGRTIPAEQAQNALTDGVTFDGSSMVGGANIEDSDMIMKPTQLHSQSAPTTSTTKAWPASSAT